MRTKSKLQHNFFSLSCQDIISGYKNKNFSPTEIAKVCIERVSRLNSKYKAWEQFDPQILLDGAKLTEKRLNSNQPIRSLEGVPIGIKDIFNTSDFHTEMGSPLWKNFTPGNDSRVVFYLRQAGALIPGKTVTAEFAVHTLEKTLNPHDITKLPGTSSSGSAVACALGMIPLALGTQTAGSIVRPASFCGVYGCKPSFGLIPRTGMLKTTDSLDTVGFLAMHFVDLERIFEIVRVHGPNYPISHKILSDPKRQTKPNDRPWRVALVKTHLWSDFPDYAREALLSFGKKLAHTKGITIEEVYLPYTMTRAHMVHDTIYNRSLAYYFKEEYKNSKLVSPVMKELISLGSKISLRAYLAALEEQTILAKQMDKFFLKYDALISLSTAGEAPARNEREKKDPALMWTLTHLPVISAPVFRSPSKLPFGVQIAARRYNDILLFRFADYLRRNELIPKKVFPELKINL